MKFFNAKSFLAILSIGFVFSNPARGNESRDAAHGRLQEAETALENTVQTASIAIATDSSVPNLVTERLKNLRDSENAFATFVVSDCVSASYENGAVGGSALAEDVAGCIAERDLERNGDLKKRFHIQ